MPRGIRSSGPIDAFEDTSSSEEDAGTQYSPRSSSPLDPLLSNYHSAIGTAILRAYRNVARIYNPSFWPYIGEAKEPWGQLGQALKDIWRMGVVRV